MNQKWQILGICFLLILGSLLLTYGGRLMAAGEANLQDIKKQAHQAASGRFGIGDVTVHLNGGADVAYIGDTNIIEFWIMNDSVLSGMSLGFEFTIGKNYAFDPVHGGAGHYVKELGDAVGAWDLTGILETPYINNVSSDSILFGGAAMMGGLPIHATHALCYTMAVYILPGQTQLPGGFCIDNIFIPPAGLWAFNDAMGGYPPEYQGNPNSSMSDPDAPAVCFDIVAGHQHEMWWKEPDGIYMPDFDQNQPGWSAYCGPTATADCLWWFHSRFPSWGLVPGGWTPPQLVDTLAVLMSTSVVTGTHVDSLQSGVDQWLAIQGCTQYLSETTVYEPDYDYCRQQLLDCQDVILLIGFWEVYQIIPDVPDPGCYELHWSRINGHFVPMAGVDTAGLGIGISDPDKDAAETSLPNPPSRVLGVNHGHPFGHNDAVSVSHDVYDVSTLGISPGGPWEILNYWYVPKFTSVKDYEAETNPNPLDKRQDITIWCGDLPPWISLGVVVTEAEAAVIICPKPQVPDSLYWKPAYPNYSPSGMPDFGQRQDTWQTIHPGPNGTIESSVAGDDVYSAANNVIAPGANCQLESNPVGDDVARWSFCGPTAVANCLWWFDSKFADPAGTPGDGVDDFPLVEGYGQFDDHESNNVPYLIEDLAGRMGTCSDGMTNIDSMQNAIDEWFIEKGLDDMFTETTYIAPDFEFIEAEIERSQDVILLLGWYNLDDPVEEMDQAQELCDICEHVGPVYWLSWQEFVPIADNLSRVEVKIARTAEYPDNHYPITMTIESPLGNFLTSKTLNWDEVIELPWCQTDWTSFDIPDIDLTPGQSYFIVLTTTGLSYHWCADPYDNSYPPGVSNFGPDWDWTFRTYYEFGGEYARQSQHYVTCAGVNSDEYLIAISDPDKDLREGSMGNTSDHPQHSGDQTVHNDAQYVSHDIYSVTIGTPDPGIGYNWWLPDYQSGYEFTVVEAAVVICPTDDTCDCEPGNCNGDANINIFDITYLISFLYLAGPAPIPYALCSGDPNCDCVINIFDVTHLISFLYISGPPPCTCQQWLVACGPPLRK